MKTQLKFNDNLGGGRFKQIDQRELPLLELEISLNSMELYRIFTRSVAKPHRNIGEFHKARKCTANVSPKFKTICAGNE